MRSWLDALGICAVAYLLRLMYLHQIAGSPLFNYLELDPRYYHDWAVEIAHGNWMGQGVFEQAPLYPYVLGVFFALFGEDLWVLRLFQIGVGALTCVLTYFLGLRLFGRRVGILAGLLCAVYGPFFFYEGQVMKEFLAVPLATGALLLLVHSRPPTPRAIFAAGVLIALAALIRDNFLLLFPLLGATLVYDSRRRILASLPLFLGGVTILLPVTVRNYYAGGDLVLTTSGGGEVFYIGNSPYANGAYRPPPWVRPTPLFEHEDFRKKASELVGRRLSRAEASHFWWKQGLRWIIADPPRALRLWIRKFELFWNDYELPDNYSFYTFTQLSWVLAHTVTFGPVAVLTVAGIALTLHAWRKLLPIYIAALGYLLSVLITFNFGRFRLAIMPVLMLFAACAIAGLWDVRRIWHTDARERVRIAIAAVLIVMALPLVFARVHGFEDELVTERLRVEAAYMQAGDVDGAERSLRRLIVETADRARQRAQGASPSEGGTVDVGQAVLALATAHRELANVLTIQQRSDEAMAELRRSSTDQAVEEYRLAARLPANDPWIDVGVGAALRAHGDSAEALNAYRRAVGKAPSNITVRLYLANAYYEQGNLDDALRELNGFLLTSTIDRQDLASYHRGLGLILARIPGRAAEAADHLSESLRLDPGARQAAEIRKLLETTRSHRE